MPLWSAAACRRFVIADVSKNGIEEARFPRAL